MIKTNVGSFDTISHTSSRLKNDSRANGLRDQSLLQRRSEACACPGDCKTFDRRDSRRARRFRIYRHSHTAASARLLLRLPRSPRTAWPDPYRLVAMIAHLTDLPFQVGEQLNYQVFLPTITHLSVKPLFRCAARSKYFNHDGLLLTLSAQTTNALQHLFFATDMIKLLCRSQNAASLSNRIEFG